MNRCRGVSLILCRCQSPKESRWGLQYRHQEQALRHHGVWNSGTSRKCGTHWDLPWTSHGMGMEWVWCFLSTSGLWLGKYGQMGYGLWLLWLGLSQDQETARNWHPSHGRVGWSSWSAKKVMILILHILWLCPKFEIVYIYMYIYIHLQLRLCSIVGNMLIHQWNVVFPFFPQFSASRPQ